jgi:hypothetical protein
MKTTTHLISLIALAATALVLSACSSPGVQDARNSGVHRRQDRIDARSSARQDRWQERGEREDARSAARFNAM